MKTDPQIDFQGMEPSEAFREQILTQIRRLEDRYGRLTACRVVVKAPGARHQTGGLYDVHIHLTLPDERQVAVERTPHLDERFQRFEFALHDAFNRAVRQLQDQVGEMRGKVKLHDEQPTGVVKKLLPEDGYGFLESAPTVARYIFIGIASRNPALTAWRLARACASWKSKARRGRKQAG